jgi:hypothetical protein
MSIAFRSIFFAIGLLFRNQEIRRLAVRPAFKTVKVYFLTLLFSIIILIVYFSIREISYSFWSILFSFSGSMLLLLLFPIITSFLYLSFFCDKEYLSIVDYVIGGDIKESLKNLEGEKFKITTLLMCVFVLMILLILVISSFFLPYLSLLLAGLIFSADIISYSLSYLGLSYVAQAKFILGNIIPLIFIGLAGVSVSFIPFAFLLVYPLGVIGGAYYVKAKIAQMLL